MKWVEIEIITTEDASDAICEMLSQLGADGIAVCDPLEIKRIIDDPESLAYAALSDRDVWGCDLREIEGLEEAVTGWLRDMQLLGARTALQRAAALSE